MKHLLIAALLAAPSLALGAPLVTPPPAPQAAAVTIDWDRTTLTWVQSGTYGRMMRLPNGEILCGYESGGKSFVVRSGDEGKTWQAPILVNELAGAASANPELLQLQNGRVLLFWNQRPRDGKQPFAIGGCFSDDNGQSWRRRDTLIFEAAADFKNGCWEPAALQLPSGEIQLFFANELPYTHSEEQEITLMRSTDNGASWSRPQAIAFRAGHRDGMPVPVLLRDAAGRPKSLVCAIEDNGLAPGNQLQPALIASSLENSWRGTVGGKHPQRWGALVPPLPGDVYAGAPYLRQLPGGETILSCQSSEGGRDKPQMVVYIGDRNARNFGAKSVPFELPKNTGGWWNSLFIKDARTVTALCETIINGKAGLWAIDGHVVRAGKAAGSTGP